jgi:transcriptional regulator of acetoin/glycerol metabolism
MADSASDELRAELARLGARRKRLETAQDTLADDVRDALSRAYGKVSVAEAARLLHLHRTTVYRVYEPHGRAA